MANLKLFTLFSALNKKELPGFQRHLKQVHGRELILIKLFQHLKKFHPDFQDEKKLDLAYLYRKVFKKVGTVGKLQRKKILNALSDLYLALQEFLLTEKALRDPFVRQVLWLNILQQRNGLDAEFSKKASQLYTKTTELPQKSINDCIKNLVAGFFHYQHLGQVKPFPNPDTYQQCMDTLLTCGETIRLKISAESENLQNIRPSTPVAKTATVPPETLNTPAPENKPLLLRCYRAIYRLVRSGQYSRFFHLKKILENHAGQLDPVELQAILRYLYNYSATQVRRGKEAEFAIAMHDINIIGLKHGFYGQKSAIPVTTLVNIVNIACTAKDFSWAESFIKSQIPSLPKSLGQSAKALAEAIIAFEQQAFAKVLRLLQPIEFKDSHLTIRAKTLSLRAYYELKEDPNVIFDYCAAFEIWLRRRRKPKTGAIEGTLEFVKVFRMLLLKKTDKQKLLNYIEMSQDLYFRGWLLSQMTFYKANLSARKRKKQP